MVPRLRHDASAIHHRAATTTNDNHAAANNNHAAANNNHAAANDNHVAANNNHAAANDNHVAANNNHAAANNNHVATNHHDSATMTERHHCILIGNGTSVRDHTRGAEIDAFENVVRFNRYLIEGHEAHVGTKTDYWFNVDLPKHVGRRIEVPYKRIYLHNWEPDAENDDLYQSFRRALPGGGFEKISHSLLDEITRYAETPEYQTWSTGAMAIWLMLKNFPHLWLTGFDWWAREEHHYGDATPRGALHRPNLEKQYIDRLLAEKKVTFL